jgi:hypothetical protein
MTEVPRREAIIAGAASLAMAPVPQETDRDLMMRFESLGENCEFGAVQRAFGAEPLDLFRWSNTPVMRLLPLLRNRFEGIGDPDKIEVFLNHPGGEYVVRHTGYGFIWHAWAKPDTATPEEIHRREVARLPWLARKITEELTEGSRIFVILSWAPITERAICEVVEAMRLYGRATLMQVTQGSPVSVEKMGDCLVRATVPNFAPRDNVLAGIHRDDWLEVCQRAIPLSNE